MTRAKRVAFLKQVKAIAIRSENHNEDIRNVVLTMKNLIVEMADEIEELQKKVEILGGGKGDDNA